MIMSTYMISFYTLIYYVMGVFFFKSSSSFSIPFIKCKPYVIDNKAKLKCIFQKWHFKGEITRENIVMFIFWLYLE